MHFLTELLLAGISILHFIVAGFLAFVSWKFFTKWRAGQNGITRGLLFVFVAFLAVFTWSAGIVIAQLLGYETLIIAWRLTRFLIMLGTVASLVWLSYEILTTPEIKPESEADDDQTD